MKEEPKCDKKCFYVEITDNLYMEVSEALMSKPYDKSLHGVIPNEGDSNVFNCRVGDYVQNIVKYTIDSIGLSGYLPSKNLNSFTCGRKYVSHGVFTDEKRMKEECIKYMTSVYDGKKRELDEIKTMFNENINKITKFLETR